MDITAFWQTSLAATVGAFLLNRIQAAMSERKSAVGLLQAALLDIDKMQTDAQVFVEMHAVRAAEIPPKYWLPAQRMPMRFVDLALTTLTPGKWLPLESLRVLHALRMWSDEANRCLDRMLELQLADDGTPHLAQLIAREGARVNEKCKHILDDGPKARAAIQAAITQHDWLGEP
jgi:hypothetical protein